MTQRNLILKRWVGSTISSRMEWSIKLVRAEFPQTRPIATCWGCGGVWVVTQKGTLTKILPRKVPSWTRPVTLCGCPGLSWCRLSNQFSTHLVDRFLVAEGAWMYPVIMITKTDLWSRNGVVDIKALKIGYPVLFWTEDHEETKAPLLRRSLRGEGHLLRAVRGW